MGNQIERLRGLLASVTYKPNWKLTVAAMGYSTISMTVMVQVTDVETKEKILVGKTTSLSDVLLESMTDNQIVNRIIYDAIWSMEQHEFFEWLKFEGKCVVNPHPEQSN